MKKIENINNCIKEYFYNIDFFRFIFIMAIALSHTKVLLKGYDISLFEYISDNIKYSHISVEMFFLIGGFFLFYTMNLKQNFYEFAKHKLIRLMPVLIFGLVLYCVLSWFTPLGFPKYDNIWAFFLLHNIGITHNYASVGASWFVSCLFWVSCLFFYMYKHIKKEHFNIILALTIIFCASFLIHNHDMGPVYNYNKFLNSGLLRALFSMGLGYFVWNFYCDKLVYIKNLKLNTVQKLIITAIEGYLTVFIIQSILFKSTRYGNYLILVLYFAILFMFLLVKQGYISELLDNKFSKFIGRYSYSIMLTHETMRSIILKVFNPIHKSFIINHPDLYLIGVFAIYITAGVITYHLVEKPATIYLKKYA